MTTSIASRFNEIRTEGKARVTLANVTTAIELIDAAAPLEDGFICWEQPEPDESEIKQGFVEFFLLEPKHTIRIPVSPGMSAKSFVSGFVKELKARRDAYQATIDGIE